MQRQNRFTWQPLLTTEGVAPVKVTLKLPLGFVGQHRHVSPVLDLVAGSAAGATAVLLTYPLDLVRFLNLSFITTCRPGVPCPSGLLAGQNMHRWLVACT